MTDQAPGSDLWAMRRGNVITVRRAWKVVLSMYGDDEARAVAESILKAIDTKEAGL